MTQATTTKTADRQLATAVTRQLRAEFPLAPADGFATSVHTEASLPHIEVTVPLYLWRAETDRVTTVVRRVFAGHAIANGRECGQIRARRSGRYDRQRVKFVIAAPDSLLAREQAAARESAV